MMIVPVQGVYARIDVGSRETEFPYEYVKTYQVSYVRYFTSYNT